MAKAYRPDDPIILVERRTIKNSEVKIKRFHQIMLHKSRTEPMLIRENALQVIGREHAAIFKAYLLVLEGADFLASIVEKLKRKG